MRALRQWISRSPNGAEKFQVVRSVFCVNAAPRSAPSRNAEPRGAVLASSPFSTGWKWAPWVFSSAAVGLQRSRTATAAQRGSSEAPRS
eukprot:symbB.v1.2.013812.t1/scaffold984.1/size146690/3